MQKNSILLSAKQTNQLFKIKKKMTGGALEERSDIWHLTFNQWTNGPMDQWSNGPMNQWNNEPMDQWTNGPMAQ